MSERITLNKVNIEELSKKQAKSTRKLTNELNQLSIQTQESLSALEDSLTLASNVSTHSLNTLRNELLQEMDTNRNELSLQLTYTQKQVDELNNTAHLLTEQLNLTEKDIEQLTLHVTREDAQIRSEVSVVHSTLLNKTHEIQNDITKELVEIRGYLNITNKMLAADIASVNSTLLDFSVMFQENLNSLSVGLDTQSNQNTLQLQTIHANLSEQITLNEVHIEELSENQTNSNQKLTTELHQLSIRTQDSFSKLEDSLMLASTTSAKSLDTLRTELLQETDVIQASVDALRGNTTTQLVTLSTTVTGIETSLSSQVGENEEEIKSLTLEARQNHTYLQTAISNNHQTVTNRLHTLQETITSEVEQVTTRVGGLGGSLTDTKQDVLRFEENIQEVEGRTETLETSQNSIMTDIQSLRQEVDDYHSDAKTSVGSKTLTCLFVMITMLAVKLFY